MNKLYIIYVEWIFQNNYLGISTCFGFHYALKNKLPLQDEVCGIGIKRNKVWA